MKAIIIPLTAAVLCLSITSVDAQNKSVTKKSKTTSNSRSEETIVIKRDGQHDKTTVEIKNGQVFVNGEKVADVHADSKTNQKIIIEDGDISADAFDKAFPLIDKGENPRRAMLGVYTENNSDIAGAEIKDIMPGTAADEAGLQSGDVITGLNGKKVSDGKQLTEIIAKLQPGDNVTVTYQRNGKEKQTEAKLSQNNAMPMARSFRFNPYGGNGYDLPNPMMKPFNMDIGDGFWEPSPKMGVRVEDLADGNGVRVLDVQENSAAAKAGLEKGDVIKKLDDEKIESVDNLQSIVRTIPRNEPIKLQYERDGERATTDIYFSKPVKKKDL